MTQDAETGDYTPTTEEVRKGYVYISEGAFDRWLAAEVEKARTELVAEIEKILNKQVRPYGDKSLPKWTERASIRELYGEDFIDALDAILASPSVVTGKTEDAK